MLACLGGEQGTQWCYATPWMVRIIMFFAQLRCTILTVLCSGLIILAGGCSESKRSDEAEQPISPSKYGGIYHRPLDNEPVTLDPAFVTSTYAVSVVQQLFDGLVQYDADLNVLPAIATSWSASRDGLTWTFQLRRGVKFHHGREVKAPSKGRVRMCCRSPGLRQ